MSVFYTIKENHVINLARVSHIRFEKKNNRILFLFDYSVKTKKANPAKNMKLVSDHEWVKGDTLENTAKIWEDICELLLKYDNFRLYKSAKQDVILNTENISSVKVKPAYVIVNFSNPITFTDSEGDDTQLTTQFVYLDIAENETPENVLKTILNL